MGNIFSADLFYSPDPDMFTVMPVRHSRRGDGGGRYLRGRRRVRCPGPHQRLYRLGYARSMTADQLAGAAEHLRQMISPTGNASGQSAAHAASCIRRWPGQSAHWWPLWRFLDLSPTQVTLKSMPAPFFNLPHHVADWRLCACRSPLYTTGRYPGGGSTATQWRCGGVAG